jgi:hypothetical protein
MRMSSANTRCKKESKSTKFEAPNNKQMENLKIQKINDDRKTSKYKSTGVRFVYGVRMRG